MLTDLHQQGPDSQTSESTGVIKEVATEPTNMTDRNVDASEESPRYLVSRLNEC